MPGREPIDLVLQGGGVKGIALVGAVDRLLEHHEIRRIGGTSVGAIVAALVAAGYERGELRETMADLRYHQVPDRALPIPGLGEITDLAVSSGLYRGDYIERWVEEKLAAKSVHTFADLPRRDDEGRDPFLSGDRDYPLVVTATDITQGRALRLPWDFRPVFGLDPATQSVSKAVRMSLSIPLFFRPCEIESSDGGVSTIVDGGVLSNFPVEMFDRQDGKPPRWPTFGAGMIPDLPGATDTLVPRLPITLPGALGLLEATVITAVVGHDQTYLAEPRNAARVFRARTGSVGVVDFDIDEQRRDELVIEGERAADEFLAHWNWAEYLERFYPR